MFKLLVHSSLTGKTAAVLLALALISACAPAQPPQPSTLQAVQGTLAPPPAHASTSTPVPLATASQGPAASLTPRLSEAPSPVATLPPASLPLPSLTPTVEPAHVTILADSQCMIGPSTEYLLYYGLKATNWMRAVGRNPDGTWLAIKSLNDPLWKTCWIQTDKVRFDNGSLRDVPIVSLVYSSSVLYQPPAVVRAVRSGNVVTVSWQPVYMTEDDERGYLVEAWVCQGGKQVFVSKGLWTSFNQNNTMAEMSLQVTDEPGCDVPSNARLYAVEKHGYTPYREIPWPGLEAGGAGTPVPTVQVQAGVTPTTETPGPEGTLPAGSPGLPVVQVPQYTDCLYGPGAYFLYKTSLPAGAWMEVAGRSPDGGWLAVQELNGWDPCWIPVAQARFTPGSLDGVPVTYPTLPISYWYKPPNTTTHRNGNEVTVSWKAIGMAEYDYRGYLVIAWVCQGGQRVYLPVSVVPAYAENTGTLSVTIQDQAGCKQASSAQIYTAEKRGYFGEKIFWPAY